jgi:tRNA(fMet)-specific endonuclease VapC
MSLYVLDTDILTLFQENHPAVVRQTLQHPRAELAVSILSVEEQLSG